MNSNAPVKLAIIGTAGRNEDEARLAEQPQFFLSRMLDAARVIADRVGADTIVTGGAAWADHVGLLLFLSDPERFSLHLHLPALLKHDPADPAAMLYLDTSSRQGGKSDARTSNFWHGKFADQFATVRAGWSPFHDLRTAFAHPKTVSHIGTGFTDRNKAVAADSDFALAMTFGCGPILKEGGTAGTMRTFLRSHPSSTAYHLDLSSMRLCRNAAVPTK